MEYYFDNSATTVPSDAVIEKMNFVARNVWGNPSSLYGKGLDAQKVIDEARANIKNSLNIRDRKSKIIFTAGGTEADNLALIGTAHAKAKNKGKKIITTKSEHPAVIESCKFLENEGYRVVYLSAPRGVVDMDEYTQELDRDTILVSVMTVNNETGAVYDIEKIFAMAKSINPEIVTHTDAVQGYLKIKLNPERIKCDLMTLSSHKIHGPKGVGALYAASDIIKSKKISPVIFGGAQEGGYRSGTENVIGIAGFGEAVKAGIYPESVRELRTYIAENLPGEITANIPAGEYAPHILNVTLPRIKSETMLHFLSSKGIYVSSGSACSSNSGHSNYVLPDFGITAEQADFSIRISLDDTLTKNDADVLISALNEGLNKLVRK